MNLPFGVYQYEVEKSIFFFKFFMDIDILIVKYLSGESTLEEADVVNRWRKSSPENELIFRQWEEAWYLTHVAMPVRPDKEKTWRVIKNKITRRYSLPFLVRVSGIAASIALVMGMAISHNVFSGERKGKIPELPKKITLYVPGGVCSKTILPDSTVVWLNSSSTISYPIFFDGSTRTVELIGEAFFDVTHDNTKPFIIKSGDLRVKVLGTSFNFKHYKEDTHAVLAVEKGVVTLSAGTSAATTVHAGKYATVDSKSLKTNIYNTPSISSSKKNNDDTSSPSPKMIHRETDVDQFTSWREYKMIFRDEPFSNVLNELSRRYNAEFEIQGEEIKEYIYTATFDDMDLDDVLKLLKMSAPIDYTIKSLTSNTMNAYGKRKVTIFRR